MLSERHLDGPGLTRLSLPGDPIESQVRIYATDDSFPRAWMVYTVEVIPDEESACAPSLFMP